jgi:ABC-2 type transport system permease protein
MEANQLRATSHELRAEQDFGLRKPKGGLWQTLKFIGLYGRVNISSNLEYRAAFISRLLGMLFNDVIWLVFWLIFYTKFAAASSYSARDTVGLFVIVALSVGLGLSVFGNATRFATTISQGGLDYYMTVPKNVLLHVLISRMDVEAIGDMAFGVAVFIILFQPDPVTLLILFGVTSLGAVVLVSFIVIANSLSFFLGQSETLSQQIFFGLVTFSHYPPNLFQGAVKAALYSIIPAAFLGYIPLELIVKFRWELFGLLALVAMLFAALATTIFYTGLRRYESGNLLTMRN